MCHQRRQRSRDEAPVTTGTPINRLIIAAAPDKTADDTGKTAGDLKGSGRDRDHLDGADRRADGFHKDSRGRSNGQTSAARK